MKISELISNLQEIQSTNGDIPVVVHVEGFGGYGEYIIKTIVGSEMYGSNVLSEGNLDDNDLKEFFPEWDGKDVDDIDTDKDVIYASINCGTEIYST